MRYLCIAILSIILFFVLFIGLHPLIGDYSAWVAAFMMYIGFPVFFLMIWKKEWVGPVVRAGNQLIALVILFISFWFAYITFSKGVDQVNAILFFVVYGYGALHFLVFGKLHFNIKDKDE